MKLYFDCETTGKNPYSCEIITAFALCESGISLHIESQVDKWSVEAEKVHNVRFEQMLNFMDKKSAWDSFLKFVGDEKEIELIVYANPQTELGYLLFDVVALKIALMNHLNIERENHLPFKISGYSVYSLAKECYKNNIFKPIKNEKTNRISFTQENVYIALFDDIYDAHNAESDVYAMKRIYDELKQRMLTGYVANNNQLSLL